MLVRELAPPRHPAAHLADALLPARDEALEAGPIDAGMQLMQRWGGLLAEPAADFVRLGAAIERALGVDDAKDGTDPG